MHLRRSPRFIALLVLVTTLGPMSMQMFLPSIDAVRVHFNVSAGVAWLALSLPMVAIAFSTLLFGPLSDRFGRKPVLAVGLAVFVGGSVLGATASDIGLVILARVLQASGASAGITLARAMSRDVYGFESSLRVTSYLTIAMVVAPTIAPVFGGLLQDSFGWRAIFYTMLTIGVALLPFVMFGLVETLAQPVAGGWRGLVLGTRELVASRRYLGYALVSATSMSIFFAFLSAAPYLMTGVLNRSASEYGVWFMAVSVVFALGTFLSTRLLNRFGADRLIAMGAVIAALLVVGTIPLHLAFALTPALLFVPAILISVVQGLVMSNCMASAVNVSPRLAGTGSGVIGFLQMILAAAVSQAIGVLADGTSLPMLWFMAGNAIASVALLALIRPFGRASRPALSGATN